MQNGYDQREEDDNALEDDDENCIESVEELVVGQKVICRHGSDEMWYPATVIRCHEDEGCVAVWIDRFTQEVKLPLSRLRIDKRNGLKLSEIAGGFAPVNDKRISMRERIAKVGDSFV